MKQKIFAIVGVVLLSIFGISIYQEFMANHTYYQAMLTARANRKLVIRAIVAAVIPILYIIRSKRFFVKKFFLFIMPVSLLIFTTAFAVVRDGLAGGSASFIILLINTLLIYFLGIYVILGLTAFGTWISHRFIKFKETRRQEMLINFGIGLGVFLLVIYICSMVHLLRGVVFRAMFLGLGYMIYRMKNSMSVYTNILSEVADEFRGEKLKANRRKWIGIALLVFSLMYYLYGFQLSFIPYSTAWDANHEYMYVPKVLAQSHGVLRGNMGPASFVPGLWHMFITYFFGLIQPIKSRFWLAPDTIAVAMNFLSGIFVLIFGTGLIKEVMGYFFHKDSASSQEVEAIGLYSGWMMILLWLTSGMGAFLVFVDNKTDLGVMALTILALLSGFVFLKHILDNREHGLKLHRDSLKYIIISGAMFAWALMAKQTAFIDIALFGLLLVGLWIDSIIAIGVGIMTVGMTGILQIANARDMMTPAAGKYILLLGAIIVVVGIIRMLKRKHHTQGSLADKKRLLTYILIRGAALVATVLVFKGPNVLISQITQGTFSPGNFIKSTLLVHHDMPSMLLAAKDTEAIQEQTSVDDMAINTSSLSPAQCQQITFTSSQLNDNLRDAVTTNEDVGRYVGYGRKDISPEHGLSLGYRLLRIVTPKNNTCYGVDREAKLFCTHQKAIEAFDIPTLNMLFEQLRQGSEAYEILSGALAAYQSDGSPATVNPTEYRDQILAIKTYYQNHISYTQAGKISIPYRYLVPFNVTFNRSLQNLSSYYTDIGFIRMLVLLLLVMGLVYAVRHHKRFAQDTNLVVLMSTAIIGWAIRWIIGGGIVRYGMGLIVRTIIAVSMLLRDMIIHMRPSKNKNLIIIILCLLAFRGLIQFALNFIRISSQGGTGPFLRYKSNNGQIIEVSDTLQQQQTVKVGYGRKDVFDLQFPHYNKFIEYVKERPDEDGILIAGTYLAYFLDNQRNIKADGMLDRFREQNSDGNLCKSYQRLKQSNLKYLVIDPNIGTVVMGDGNESLFNRFFAKRNPVTGKIEDDGAISSLVKLRNAGYIHLFGTNNLGAKYAFSLSDAALQAKFGSMSADDLVYLRAKLSVARFFPDAQELIDFIAEIFTARVSDGQAIGDIADVYGKDVNQDRIASVAQQLLAQQSSSDILAQSVASLSQDERIILLQYLGLVNIAKSDATQYQQFINSLLGQSLGGGSQLIIFELN